MARTTKAWLWFMAELEYMEPSTVNSGTYANKAGYHNTRANLLAKSSWRGDYSIQHSLDREGPDDASAAADWTFTDAQAGRYTTINKYMRRIEAAFYARDARLSGWREVLGQSDIDPHAEGFDFGGWYTRTPDPTHLWHIHFSERRKFTEEYRTKAAMLSILRGDTLQQWREEEWMMANIQQRDWDALWGRIEAIADGHDDVRVGPVAGADVFPVRALKSINSNVTKIGEKTVALETKLNELMNRQQTITFSNDQINTFAHIIGEKLVNASDNSLSAQDLESVKNVIKDVFREGVGN